MSAARPRIRDDLATAAIGRERVVYDVRTGQLHHLNATAALVYELCDGTARVADLADEIAKAFGAPREEVIRDLRALVRDFRERGLLAGSDAASDGDPADGSDGRVLIRRQVPRST